jgi:DNA-binding response OmpR family regulator
MAKVLILEDEPSIAGIAAHKLRREGHEVRCEELLDGARLAAWAPALVVLDLDADHAGHMLEELVPGWPVLALTGFNDAAAVRRATDAGATATLAKPFKPTVLARVVNDIVSGRTS